MKYSFKLRINRQRIRPDGTAALFFQIIIEAKKTTIPLELYWPVDRFDDARSSILPRQRGDRTHEEYTRLIERKGNDINEVFIWAKLAQVELSLESFHRELANQHSRQDFLFYWGRKVEENYVKGLIKKATYSSQKSSLETLRAYRQSLQFNELSKSFLEDYKAWLFRTLGSGNTV